MNKNLKSNRNENINRRTSWNKGKKLSIEHKKNLSLAHKGKIFSEEHKVNISNSLKGRIIKWNKKISDSLTGRKLTEEQMKHIKKLAESRKGHPLSEKTKKKISEKLKGRIFSKERNRKVSASLTGRKLSEQHRKKIGEATKGRKHSEKTKKKMSEDRGGDKSPSWRGGISFEPYTPEFNSTLKRKIRKRDNYTCQLCDKTEKEIGRNLSVHHIDYNKKNCKESNLITLCRGCNGKVNYNRLDWMNYFRDKLKNL